MLEDGNPLRGPAADTETETDLASIPSYNGNLSNKGNRKEFSMFEVVVTYEMCDEYCTWSDSRKFGDFFHAYLWAISDHSGEGADQYCVEIRHGDPRNWRFLTVSEMIH